MAGLLSLAASLTSTLHKKQGQVLLTELSERDDSSLSTRAFQYFPESLSDTKNVDYTPRKIPGASLPVYQWVSSGERHISFTAVFTTDVNLLGEDGSASPEAVAAKIESTQDKSRNVDIRSAIVWLRRFMMPRYGAAGQIGVPITYGPRKIMLHIPNSGIGLAGGGTASGVGPDSIICIMQQCDVTWETFFTNNLPRTAKVQLSFSQIPQFKGAVAFPSPDAGMDLVGGIQPASDAPTARPPIVPYTIGDKSNQK
jgi:hypothetical protein